MSRHLTFGSLNIPGLNQAIAWFLGFAAIFNPYLTVAEAEGAPRLTDLLGLMLWAVLVLRLLSRAKYAVRFPIELKIALLLIALWFVRDLLIGEPLSGIGPVRWFLVVPYAYALYRASRDSDTRFLVTSAICIGVFANVCVIIIQSLGYRDLITQLHLSSGRGSEIWVATADETALRPSGMWGHPNASAGVVAICIPIICGLIDERRLKPRWIILAWATLFITSALTFTRSGVVVSCIVCAIWALNAARTRTYLRSKFAMLGAALIGIVVIGPPGGWSRWTGEQKLLENAGERIETTVVSLRIALGHPFGMGSEYLVALGRATSSGIEATHNAWLFLALVAGLPLTVLMLVGITRNVLRLLRSSTCEGWLALQMLGLFLFEEFFRIPAFIILSLWLVIVPSSVARPRIRRAISSGLSKNQVEAEVLASAEAAVES
jgi:hypothetical protein